MPNRHKLCDNFAKDTTMLLLLKMFNFVLKVEGPLSLKQMEDMVMEALVILLIGFVNQYPVRILESYVRRWP